MCYCASTLTTEIPFDVPTQSAIATYHSINIILRLVILVANR